MHAPLPIQVGDKYGKLTAIGAAPKADRRRRYFFLCDCGSIVRKPVAQVVRLLIRSCGCLLRASRSKRKMPDNRAAYSQVIRDYQRHARDRGFVWGLSFETCVNLFSQPCYYCGVVGGNKKGTRGLHYNGIDRVDSSLGYDLDNIVPCCGQCNRAKRDVHQAEFLAWVTRVYLHQNGEAQDVSEMSPMDELKGGSR